MFDPQEAIADFVYFLAKETKFLSIKGIVNDIEMLIAWILRNTYRYSEDIAKGKRIIYQVYLFISWNNNTIFI